MQMLETLYILCCIFTQRSTTVESIWYWHNKGYKANKLSWHGEDTSSLDQVNQSLQGRKRMQASLIGI